MAEMELSIVIDRVRFTLLGKSNQGFKGARELIVVESLDSFNERNEFVLYTSLSSIKQWRLVLYNGRDFIKSDDDYVQGNLIHYDLQFFINRHFHSLPIYEMTPEQFDQLTRNRPDLYDAIQNIEKWSDHVMFTSHTIQSLGINLIDNSPFISLQALKGDYTNYHIPYKCGKENTSEQYQYMNHLGNLIEELYTMNNYQLSHLQTLDDTVVYDEDRIHSVPVQAHMNLSKIKMTRNDKYNIPLHYFLYFAEYDLTFDLWDRIVTFKNYRIPLALTNDRITKFGLFEEHFNIGNYICKFMDYSKQCDVSVNREFKCTNVYTFLGHFYNNIYPFNKLAFNEPPSVSVIKKNSFQESQNQFGYQHSRLISPQLIDVSTRSQLKNPETWGCVICRRRNIDEPLSWLKPCGHACHRACVPNGTHCTFCKKTIIGSWDMRPTLDEFYEVNDPITTNYKTDGTIKRSKKSKRYQKSKNRKIRKSKK